MLVFITFYRVSERVFLMQQAHIVDRLVRITNFYEKIDEFNDKPVLTLGQHSRVQYSTRPIPYEQVKGIVEK